MARPLVSPIGLLFLIGLACPVRGAEPAEADSARGGPSDTASADSATTPSSPFRLPPPPPVRADFLYAMRSVLDFERGIVVTTRSVGRVPVGAPTVQPLQDYVDRSIAEKLAANLTLARRRSLNPEPTENDPTLQMQFQVPNLPPMAKSIIGEGPSTLHVSGYGRITMSGESQYQTGESIGSNIRQSKFPTLAMKQELSFQIDGTIGSKIQVAVDQDTRRISDLENNIRLRYQGEDDEVIKEVEMGNTSLSLQGPRFISGSRQNKGLFGIKGRGEMGNLEFTLIASQQKSSAQKKTFRGGAQQSEVKIDDYSYVLRRFFFLDEFYRGQYGRALEGIRDNPQQTALLIPRPLTAGGAPFVIQRVEVYRLVSTTAQIIGQKPGVAIHRRMTDDSGNDITRGYGPFDPAVIRQNGDGTTTYRSGDWVQAAQEDYTIDQDIGFIDFQQSLPAQSIGVIIYYTDATGQQRQFPESTDGTKDLVLKLITTEQPKPDDPFWGYEWRHVYSVGARDLDPNDFKLVIVKPGPAGDRDSPTSSPGTYLQIMKLDAAGPDLTGSPDGILDINPVKVDLARGLVMFPYLEAFKEAFAGLADEGNATIYETSNTTTLQNSRTYQLIATYSKAATRVTLGFGILENSEVIRLNGRRLTKDIDYSVDYFTGQVDFKQTVADQINQPGADLAIDYEVNPVFSLAQESLLGMRGVYKLGERGQIGGTFMFNSERTAATRVRVGEEPTRMTLAGLDARYDFKPYWLTRFVDRLPFVESDEPSVVHVEGEVAQSMPNLNTRGFGYVDDFEGTSNLSPLGIYRRGWVMSSQPIRPAGISELDTLSREKRGSLVWFNPYTPGTVRQVWWSRKDDISASQAQGVQVMNLWFRPKLGSDGDRRTSWGGVMRSFGMQGVDLQRTQFLEIWMRVSARPFSSVEDIGVERPRGSPVLHVELGDISEDVLPDAGHAFGQPNLNNEDDIVNPLYINVEKWVKYNYRRNGRLEFTEDDLGEDVGLDGCPDQYEDGQGGSLPYPNPEYKPGDDPNGDNWSAPSGEPRSIYEYQHINGTQGNHQDGEGTPLPDEEDLNGNGSLDRQNRHLRYSITLDGDGSANPSPYEVEGSEEITGFKLYRIPLKKLDVTTVDSVRGRPDFSQIGTIRLWVSGVQDTALWVTVATMDFVGNDWEEVKAPGDEFTIATVNTQNNKDYAPPPGVERETDPVTGERLPEQAIALQFASIPPGHTYHAQRVLLRDMNLTDYRRLRMFVHGPDQSRLDPNWDHLAAFLRIGFDTTNYYEVRVPRLYPGWDERNTIDISLDSLTNLKLARSGAIYAGTDTISRDGRLRVIGKRQGDVLSLPSLTRIRLLQLGIVNLSDHPIGRPTDPVPMQVYFDDLRLEGVRNIQGRAIGGDVNVKMADLASFLVHAEQREIGFGSLQDKRGSPERTQSFSVTMDRLRIDKLLPPNWRVSIPLNVSYNVRTGVPRLKSGSDIELVREEDRRVERSRAVSFNASTSFTKTSRSRNPLIGMTLDRVDMGLTYRISRGLTPSRASDSRDSSRSVGYTARFNYDLSPRSEHHIRPFAWTSALMPDAVSEMELHYLPTTLRFDANTTFTSDSTWTFLREGGRDTSRVQGTRTFALSEAYRVAFQPFRAITASYDLGLERDLRKALEADIGPQAAARAVVDNIFRRNEIRRSQRVNVSYSPTWPWWLSHSYSFSNSYNDNSDPRTNAAVAQGGKTFSISSQRSYGISSVTLRLKDIFGRLGGQASGGGSTPRPPGAGGVGGGPQSGGGPSGLLRGSARYLGTHVENLTGRVGYAESFSGSQVPEGERPGFGYQILGMGPHPEPQGRVVMIGTASSISRSVTWSAGSGLTLPLNMRLRGNYAYGRQRNFTPRDTTRRRDVTFPDLTYSWEGIEGLPLLRRVASRSDIQSAFQRQVTEQWQTTAGAPERLQSKGTQYRLSPLFAWNILWRNRVRSTVRSVWTRSLTGAPSGGDFITTEATHWEISLNGTYDLQTSQGVRKLWGGGVWRLKGDVSFSCEAKYAADHVVGLKSNAITGGDEEREHTRAWSVTPRASYRFSRAFTGEAGIVVGVRQDLINQRTIQTRGVRISGELRFN